MALVIILGIGERALRVGELQLDLRVGRAGGQRDRGGGAQGEHAREGRDDRTPGLVVQAVMCCLLSKKETMGEGVLLGLRAARY